MFFFGKKLFLVTFNDTDMFPQDENLPCLNNTNNTHIIEHQKFSPPTWGFFLAPVEGCSVRLQTFGPKVWTMVILPDKQTDKRTDEQKDNRF